MTLLALLAACQTVEPADVVFTGGPIRTADPARPQVEAVAIRDGWIVYAGDEAGLAPWIGPATLRRDLAGAALLPGLADGHLHLLGLGAALEQVDLVGTRSLEEVISRVVAAAAELPPEQWLLGRGWDQNDWPDPSFPTHDALSAALPERPAVLTRIDGHALLANAAAMRAAGVTAQTPDPPGGRILRRPDGTPTGVFVDAAEGLIRRAIPAPGPEDLRRRALLAQAELHRHGITAVHDAGIGEAGIEVLRALAAEGRFLLRWHGMLDGSDEPLLRTWFARGPAADLDGSGRLAVRSVKLYADGALGSRGAALHQDYSDDPGNRGLLVTPPERLRQVTERALRAGFQVGIHAIGDRGNTVALDAFEQALAAVPAAADPRLRIEHAQVLREEDAERFARLGVIAAMQAQHQTSDMPWVRARLGPEREKGAYAWRWLLDRGVPICGGSDAPVERLDPMAAFRAAVTRRDENGRPPEGWHPEQCMTREEALLHLTVWPARAAFREEDLGRIAPGMRADLVVLSRDPLSAPVAELDRIEVLETWFDGRRVFPADPGEPILAGASHAETPR
ncbi:MAG: amidohydrolase [Planctomycetota bacterium]|nr:MAG: amidohydrolase [Planctomycetota bacterium]